MINRLGSTHHIMKFFKSNSKVATMSIILFFKLCPVTFDFPPLGALNFFLGRGVRPGFPKCGACKLLLLWKGGGGTCELKISKFGGLWTENFQIWRLVSLKISKFGGLRAKIWAKIEAVEAKISKVSQKGVLWTDSFAWNGTLANFRGGVKVGSSGLHIPIPPF